jgi:putative SOS response-associated peptidase YedK
MIMAREERRPFRDRLAELFRDVDLPALAARCNIAPSEQVLAVRLAPGGRDVELVRLRWGLVPAWSRDRRAGRPLIFARAETAATRPAFRDAFRHRRCLVMADGFFGWDRRGGRRRPYHVRLKDGRPFAFAGLWESWRPPGGEAVETCAVLTTPANAVVRPLNHRMPAILPPDEYEAWLGPDRGPEAVQGLLRPYPAEAMEARPVSRFVNDPRHKGRRCLEPASEGS